MKRKREIMNMREKEITERENRLRREKEGDRERWI